MTTDAQTSPGNVRKAAVLLAALPARQSAALLSRLKADEAHALAREMRQIEPIDFREQQSAMRAFVADGRQALKRSPRVFSQENTAETADEENGNFCFRFLNQCNPDDVIACLAAEHPQTIALVVSQLSSELTMATMAALPSALARDVRRRIARLSPCNEAVLDDVAGSLHEALSRLRREPARPRISILRNEAVDQAV